jgi:flotillin
VDKQVTLTLKAREAAEADAQRAQAEALKQKAEQEVITVAQVAEAERSKQVAIVASEKEAQQRKIQADVDAYRKRLEAEAMATAQKAAAEGHADSARFEAQGAADALKFKAKAEADAADMQAISITKIAEANRTAGLKEAEVSREKAQAANAKSRDILLQETALKLIEQAPAIIRELVKPAEKIAEIKVLQVSGGIGAATGAGGNGVANGAQMPLLGNALGPVAKSILDASAVLPVLREVMRFADPDGTLKEKAAKLGVDPNILTATTTVPAKPKER